MFNKFQKFSNSNTDNDKLQSIFTSWNRNMKLMYNTCLKHEWIG